MWFLLNLKRKNKEEEIEKADKIKYIHTVYTKQNTNRTECMSREGRNRYGQEYSCMSVGH
jgi:hypothetical protein